MPVIVRPNVGAKDLVEDGRNGYIPPVPQDTEAAVVRMAGLADAALRSGMGVAASQAAAKNDWEKLAETMEGLYQEVLAGKAGQTGGVC